VAAFLYAQLEQADEILTRRRAAMHRYEAALQKFADLGRVELPRKPPKTTGNGHMFYLLMNDRADRDAYIAYMRSHGINAVFHYVPLHSSPAGQRFGITPSSLPFTDDISDRLVRLPMYFALGEDIETVLSATGAYLEK
jgi:dTDP-4-amino-4,6-dideoxygalactose transaminase